MIQLIYQYLYNYNTILRYRPFACLFTERYNFRIISNYNYENISSYKGYYICNPWTDKTIYIIHKSYAYYSPK